MLGILSDDEIENTIKNNLIGRIGCRDGDEIYIVPVTYLYAEQAVVCHSFEGKKLRMMRNNPTVCFEVEDISDFQNWKCIIAKGRFEELTDTTSIAFAKEKLTEVALKKKTSLTSLSPAEYPFSKEQMLQGISVFYKIHLGRISGRFESTQ